MQMLLSLVLFAASAFIADAGAPVGDPIQFVRNTADNIFERHLDGISNNSDIQLYAIYNGIRGQVKPNRTMRILDFVGVLMPAFADTLDESGYNFIQDQQNNPFNFKMSNFTIDFDYLELAMGTAPVSDIQLVPGFLRVSDVTTEVRIYAERDEVTGKTRFGLNGFGLAATWWIGDTGLDFKLTKVGGTFYFYGAPRTGTVPIGSFFSTLGEAILPDGPVKSTLEKSGLDEFSLEKTRFRARYSKLDGFALALSGRPTIADWSAFDMTVLFHRYRSVPWREGLATNVVTMATILDSFRLSTVVKTLVGLDMSEIPVLGSLVVPRLGVVVSTGDVAPNFLPEIVDDPLLRDAQPFRKGVTLATRFALEPDLEPIRFLIRAGPNDLSFKIVDYAATLTVRNLIGTILPDFNLDSLLLPSGVSNVFDVAISEFSYDHRLKVLTTRLALDKSVVIIPNLVTIDKSYLRIKVTLSKPQREEVEASGQWLLGSSKVLVRVNSVDPIVPNEKADDGPPRPAKGFMIKAEGSAAWNIGELMGQFGASFLPDEFDSILASFADFRILEPKAQIPVGLSDDQFLMFLAGRPEIGGWNDTTLNALIAKKGGKTSMAVGFEFANAVDFSWLVKKLTRFDISYLKMFARSLPCGFVLAKQSAPDVALLGDLLQNVPIQRGIGIVARFSFPNDCDGDVFCEYAKQLLGANTRLRLSATVTSLREFTLYAGVDGSLELGPKLTLTDAGLEFVVGPESTVGITATLKLVDPPLSFLGAIRVGPVQGLELSMTMIGIWKKPLSIPFLALGNAHLAVSLRPGVGVTALQIGGELRIGNIGNGKEIIAVVHVGVDSVSPRRNYFYGKINKATIPALMNAFDFDVKVPKVLSQIGFPDGLETSFAYDTVQLPTGLVIPAGFKLKGTLVILGYKLKCDIELTPPSAMRVLVEMDPLNLAGQIILQRSRSDSKRGPILNASVALLPAPKVLVRAAGYVKLFGLLNREAALEIDDKSFTIEVVGKLFLFDFKVRVSASYGSLKTAAFRVYAEMSSGGMSTIAKRVRDIIDKAAKDATKKIGDAQAKVDSANKAYDDAIRSLERHKKEVDALQAKYDAAIRDLERKKGDVDALQKIYDAAIRELESKNRALGSAQKTYDDAIRSLEQKKKDVENYQRKYDAAIKHLQDAKRRLDSAQRSYDAATRILESKRRSVDSAQRKYNDAVNNLNRKRDAVNRVCRMRHCGSVRFSYACGVRTCGGRWARYPCGVNTCHKTVTDPACIAFNDGCRGVRTAAYAALEIAKRIVNNNRWPLDVANGALATALKIVDNNRWTLNVAKGTRTAAQNIVNNNRWPLDVAKGALSAAQNIVNKNRWPIDAAKGALTLAEKVVNKNQWSLDVAKGALTVAQQVVDKNRWPLDAAKGALTAAQKVVDNNRWPLDAAKGVLEGVKYTVKAGAAAAKFIASVGLGGLIDIIKLTFDVKIGLVSSGHVAGSATVSFLSKTPTTFSFNIRMNSIESMAKDFAEMAFQGIAGRRRRRRRDTSGFSERHYFPERFVYRPGLFERYSDRMIVDDELPVLPSISRGSDEDYVDLKSRLIDERPDTVEAKCEHYRSLVGVLRILLETFGAVSSGVQQTVKDYLTTNVDLAEAIVEDDNGTNGTLVDVDDVCTKAATSFLSRNEVPVTVGFNSSSLRQMMSLNYDGMTVLEDLLKNATLKKTGLTPRQYLTKLVQSLLFPYQEVARSNPKARRVARILQRISVDVESLFEETLYEARLTSQRLLKDLDDIEKIPVFCVHSADEAEEPRTLWDNGTSDSTRSIAT